MDSTTAQGGYECFLHLVFAPFERDTDWPQPGRSAHLHWRRCSFTRSHSWPTACCQRHLRGLEFISTVRSAMSVDRSSWSPPCIVIIVVSRSAVPPSAGCGFSAAYHFRGGCRVGDDLLGGFLTSTVLEIYSHASQWVRLRHPAWTDADTRPPSDSSSAG